MNDEQFRKAIRDEIAELRQKHETVKTKLDRIPDNEKGRRGEVYLELTEISQKIEKLEKYL